MSTNKFINDVNWLDTIGLHCLITLAGMLSNPEAFFIFILSIFLFNSIRCYRLEFKIFLHIHMIFNFHYTRVSSGVIYLILVFTIYMIFYAITLCFIMFICPFVGPLIWTNKILSYLILYNVFPNFICNCREESIELFRNFTCIIYNFIVFTQNYILIPRVTFFREKWFNSFPEVDIFSPTRTNAPLLTG